MCMSKVFFSRCIFFCVQSFSLLVFFQSVPVKLNINQKRCISVHEGRSNELYPVSIGIIDQEDRFHLVEASRTLSRQLRIWAKAHPKKNLEIAPPIESVTLTHLHLGHIDGLGQFGREAMGRQNIRLLGSKPLIDDLAKKSYLGPFSAEIVQNGSSVILGKGVSVEFHRVPHRDHETGETHAIVVRGIKKSLLFLPDHDTWLETLRLQNVKSIREWIQQLKVDVALIDGTFFCRNEVAGRREDSAGIPHPPISETLELLGKRVDGDAEIFFIHLNHTNPVIDDPEKKRQVEALGWHIGEQGHVWDI